jgi:phosphatidylglycerophosphate synthase
VRTLNRTPVAEIRDRTYKSRDAWWTVLLVDPVAVHIVRYVAPYRRITPNLISVVAFALGLAAAGCFLFARPWWLVAGALLFHTAFVLDCVDGKVARLNGTGTVFGAWLDYMMDRVRVVTCTAALVGAQWHATGNDLWLALGGLIIFLEMFHNLNALETLRVKGQMRRHLSVQHERRAAALGDDAGLPPRFVEEVLTQIPAGEPSSTDLTGTDRTVVDLNGEFRSRFGAFVTVRNVLRRGRIRPNLVSTIEFAMVVFIVAPLTGAAFGQAAMIGVILGISLLVALFDASIIYKFYLTTQGFQRQLARATAEADTAQGRVAEGRAATAAPRVQHPDQELNRTR